MDALESWDHSVPKHFVCETVRAVTGHQASLHDRFFANNCDQSTVDLELI